MASLKLWLLGPSRIEYESVPVEIQRRKAVALLVYLAVKGESQPRDSLATLLWPDSNQSDARTALRRDLSALNKALGRSWLEIDRERVGLERKPGLWLDVEEFQRLLAACRAHGHPAGEVCSVCLPLLGEAVELYRADFLTGFTLPDSPEFDEWQFFQTESLRRELASALERLVRGYGVGGDAEREQAIAYARRWLALDPLHEPAHQQLMQLYAWAGQQALALRQYQQCVRLLDEELGVAPSAETTELFETIKARRISLPPSRAGAPLSSKVYVAPDPQVVPPRLPSFLGPKEAEPIDLEQPVFVACEPELARLNGFLDLALAGQGQVVFVIGEAGRGKTALVQEFARRAQAKQADLIVAGGNCNAYTGLGDPYLPFREIMGLLTGDIETRWAAKAIHHSQAQRLWAFMPRATEALLNSGPDLIDAFIPGPGLVTRTAAAVTADTGWLVQLRELVTQHGAGYGPTRLNQSDLFEQYAKVILALAGRQPLLLALDDLQWADEGSINLLFHLGRRLSESRVLIIGAYRPDAVALGREGKRHPLEPLVNEFQRQFGAIFLDLSQVEGRQFVNSFLDTQPNQLGPDFREALYQHTKGHALFTVEMLRGLQEREDLVKDESGRWVEGPALNWDILPARVEGVIGERLGRLPTSLQETLKIASIEGEVFRAEVVARVQAADEQTMVRQLSGELDRQHQLVIGQGSRRLKPGGQRLSFYRFRHYLFQHYLYHNLDEAERIYLHEAVGNELEQLYAEQTEEVAVELARHFEVAGLVVKAVHYLHQAGSRAVRLSANEEALGHFNRALALLGTLPETPERNRQELALQIAISAPLTITKGYSASELEQTFSRAWTLYQEASAQDTAPAVENVPQLFEVLYGLWVLKQVWAELPMARELAEQMLDLAQRQGDSLLLMSAHWVVGNTLYWLGEFAPAQEHFEQSMALYDPRQHRSHVLLFGQDQGVTCLAYQAWNLWQLGYPDQALKRSRDALTLAKELAHPHSLVYAIIYAAHLHIRRGEWQALQKQVGAELALATEHGFPYWQAVATIIRGKTLAEQGQVEEGIVLMCQGLATLRAQGADIYRPYFLALLADAYGKVGQAEEGLSAVTEALAAVEKTAEHLWEPELYRLKGELLLTTAREGRGMKDQSEAGALQQAQDQAEACFWQAIEVARRQEAKSLELRAVMSLSRLWHSQGSQAKKAEVHQMLAEIYGWFTEGFDTLDLKEARALLDALA
jgi:DNA-binding SARP family transcriptional activator/predicted ATPase